LVIQRSGIGRFPRKASEAIANAGASSVAVLHIPDGKPDKWDAYDAIEDGLDVWSFVKNAERTALLPTFGAPPNTIIPPGVKTLGAIKSSGIGDVSANNSPNECIGIGVSSLVAPKVLNK
jgi:hypothetical protein